MLAMQMQEAAARMMRGRDLNWAAFPLTGVFETTDRPVVMVGAFKPNPLRDICPALEIDDLSKDVRYADFDRQRRDRADLQAIFRARFKERDSAHWLSRLEAVDILCAPVRTLAEALEDEQTLINDDRGGRRDGGRAGPRWSAARSTCRPRRWTSGTRRRSSASTMTRCFVPSRGHRKAGAA